MPEGAGEQAEAASRESEERLRLIVENARGHAIFTTDLDGIVKDWFGGAESVFGYRAEEIEGMSSDILFVPEDRAAGVPEEERAAARGEGKAPDVRWHLRKGGSRVFIHGVSTALHDAGGAVTGFLKIGQDATAIHEAEERRKTLLAELQHRVRNTLAVIQSIARRTAETSETIEDMSAHLQGRIEAFARVQAVVTRDVEGGADLAALVADELLALATSEGRHLAIEGPDLLLAPRTAEAFSLAIHELATNAVKYGALAARDGRVEVRWARRSGRDGERLHFIWEEKGRDRALVAAEHKGFGFELLQRTLPYELDAATEIEFLAEGLRFTLEMPLEGRLAARRGAEEALRA